ncbi:hypothetical protein [Leptolyngbya sp. NIES-2104]|uniref:hypothetical protein n=1 Tax=Leptolyngbya sp. NIES-2104 TaxID=1552121 RepID=UPI0006ECCA4C|nr:hypothetical protein [Leptolyngbya sp. NIES-2104]GAP97376.1 hypothetical protein NIES2104_39230 [Leptolyngbya sp. NIES-2104]
MKVKLYDQIQTLVDVSSDFNDRPIPSGTIGTIVECYTHPEEGYAVDLRIANPALIGEATYENVILQPEQFIVIPQPAKIIAS